MRVYRRRVCSCCKYEKPVSAFLLSARWPDGLSKRCESCSRRKTERGGSPQERAALAAEGKKRCFKCSVVKPREGFYRHAGVSDGLSSHCRLCRCNADRRRDKDLVRKTHAARRMTDQGRLVQRLKKARRRAGLKGVLTAAEWVRLIAAWGSRCAYCRAAGVKLTIDHVVPLARGGWNVVQNVVPACRYCNCSLKKDRPVDVVLARLGLDRFRWQARRQFAVRAALA